MGARIPPQRHFIFNKDSVFLPFLYRTRTLTVPYRQSPKFISAHQHPSYGQPCRYSTHSTAQISAEPSHLYDKDPSYEQDDATPRKSYLSSLRTRKANSFKPEPAQHDGRGHRRSTITPTERRLFQRLLKKSGPSASPELTNVVQTVSRKTIADQSEKDEVDDITNIMDMSLKKLQGDRERGSRTKEEDDSLGPLPEFKEPNIRQLNQMSRLGKVVAKLRRFEKSDIDGPSENLAGMDPFPIAYLTAQREADKICNEMDDAVAAGKGDLGVWRICEERIFAMLDLVAPEENGPSSVASDETDDNSSLDVTEESKVEKITHSPVETAKLAEIGLEIPPDIPVVDVVRQIYPRVLLHAMRIFHLNFPVSHFATQLPEKAKSHSRFSRLVGASTDFYNELMTFVWGFYSDIPQVTTFLREMEVTGVPFDTTTLRIAEDVRDQWESAKADSDVRKGEGRYVANTWWWDTPAASKAYRELVEGNEENPGWITKIRTQIRKDLTFKRRRRKYTKYYIEEQFKP